LQFSHTPKRLKVSVSATCDLQEIPNCWQRSERNPVAPEAPPSNAWNSWVMLCCRWGMKLERTRNDSKSCRYIVYLIYIDKHTQYVCVYMYIYIYISYKDAQYRYCVVMTSLHYIFICIHGANLTKALSFPYIPTIQQFLSPFFCQWLIHQVMANWHVMQVLALDLRKGLSLETPNNSIKDTKKQSIQGVFRL